MWLKLLTQLSSNQKQLPLFYAAQATLPWWTVILNWKYGNKLLAAYFSLFRNATANPPHCVVSIPGCAGFLPGSILLLPKKIIVPSLDVARPDTDFNAVAYDLGDSGRILWRTLVHATMQRKDKLLSN